MKFWNEKPRQVHGPWFLVGLFVLVSVLGSIVGVLLVLEGVV